MFETSDRIALSEDQFEEWLEKGRNHKMGYHFMMLIWNALDKSYFVKYLTDRDDIQNFRPEAQEEIVAIYDLYSESRIFVNN